MKKRSINGAVVTALTPYVAETKAIDLDAFSRYIGFVADEGAETIIVPSSSGDVDLLSCEERQQLVAAAVKTAGDKAMILATVTESDELSPVEQAKAYLAAGADGLNIRIPTADSDVFATKFEEILGADPGYVVIDDNKSGSVDMNNMGRSAAASGVSVRKLAELAAKHASVKAVMIDIPLNECGPKTSAILKETGGKLGIVSTATDQALEMLDRGSDSLVTPVFVRVMNRLCALFREGGFDRARPLFFDFLRVIVWTKQFIHRGPYLHQLYLKEKGILSEVAFRPDRPIDRYQIAYGREMLDLALDIESKLDQY